MSKPYRLVSSFLPPIKFWAGSIILLCVIAFCVNAELPSNPPLNFGVAKRLAREIHADHRFTFYCGCKYDKHNKVNLKSCGYRVQGDKRRARRLEWEHIMPTSLWGNTLACWKEPICCKEGGEGEARVYYKGRQCCREQDPHFAQMEGDLHNIVPEIGELNALRSNYRFAELPHITASQLGACEFKIDKETRRVEPRAAVKGMVARAYLYMAATYNIPLSDSQRQLFVAWNRQYPPEAWEMEWNKRIAAVQGNLNPYISHYQDKK